MDSDPNQFDPNHIEHKNSEQDNNTDTRTISQGPVIIIGLVLGVIFGSLTDNLAAGVGIGLAVGIALPWSKSKRDDGAFTSSDSSDSGGGEID